MGTIYLVRHGQAPAHAYTGDPGGGPGLTDLGYAQARATGVALARRVTGFDAAICGDLPRQQATIAGVLEAFPESTMPHVDADWNEYVTPALPEGDDIHADGGRPFQDALDDALAAWVAGADIGPETYASFIDRTGAAADRAAALAGSGRSVLVVSSAGVITALIARLWGVPAPAWPQLSRTFVNGSITTVIAGRRGLTPVSINDHAHLADVHSGLATFR
ncbi:histidine phosphatase family protein [Gordonia shandongensis]|uniref:histidine phosphatase family protein n=1 Tax=Gordonia shandongensis TaxID=376351 RepID=UPI000426244A|nr:histidine phosphatase family protein [Gordonia shandongensis]